MRCNLKKHMQIEKSPANYHHHTWPHVTSLEKYSQHNQIQQCAAKTEAHAAETEKHCKYSQPNTENNYENEPRFYSKLNKLSKKHYSIYYQLYNHSFTANIMVKL